MYTKRTVRAVHNALAEYLPEAQGDNGSLSGYARRYAAKDFESRDIHSHSILRLGSHHHHLVYRSAKGKQRIYIPLTIWRNSKNLTIARTMMVCPVEDKSS